MEKHFDGTILIRLEHMYDAGEDDELSKPTTVSLDVSWKSTIFFKFF